MQREPQPPRPTAAMPLKAVFRALGGGENGRLLLYLMAAQAAVQIAGPYFNPYMLGQLHFSYTIYAVVICTSMVAKVYFLPTVGRIADRVGVRRVFWTSAVASTLIPSFWLVSHHWVFLVFVQIYSGMAWCAFDLATLLLFIETIPRQKRVDVLAFFNLANSVAMAGGSLLGAGLLALLGGGQQAYLTLFGVSTLARIVALLFLMRMPARRVAHSVVPSIPSPHFIRKPLPAGAFSAEARATAASGRV
jgi:MFS family permease